MKQFNYKQFLTENTLTQASKLRSLTTSLFESEEGLNTDDIIQSLATDENIEGKFIYNSQEECEIEFEHPGTMAYLIVTCNVDIVDYPYIPDAYEPRYAADPGGISFNIVDGYIYDNGEEMQLTEEQLMPLQDKINDLSQNPIVVSEYFKKTDESHNMNENTKTQLRVKIKEMIIAELEKDVNISDETPENEEDFLAEFVREAKKSKKDDTEAELADTDINMDDIDIDPTASMPMNTGTTEIDPKIKLVQDDLEKLQASAEKLGDEKLLHQIGNTITFFTRTHVAEKPPGNIAEGLKKSKYLNKKFINSKLKKHLN